METAKYEKVGLIGPGALHNQEMRLAWWVMCLEEVLAWHMGVVLDAYTVKKGDDEWTLRVQGRRRMPGRKTTACVTWASAHSPFACFELFAALVRRNEVQWREDKYPVVDEPV